MKTIERDKAIKLRKAGRTYAEISQQLGVSKGSLSLWLCNIPYLATEESKQKRRLASINNGRILHRRKIEKILKIKELAKKEMPNIKSEEMKLLGIMAYWAEGSKTQDSLVKFTNANPKFIKFSLKWLREICQVPEEKLRLHLRIHKDVDKEKVENYWSQITRIPKIRFFKTTIKMSNSKGTRHNKLSNGIASIIVCDTKLFYKISGWIEFIIDKMKL